MIKTQLSTMIGSEVILTTGCPVIGGQQNIDQIIKSLFTDGTQGFYLNAQNATSVSDLSSIKDLSGRNNHATQANATSRATLITDPSGYKSLKFDGIDDGYVTQSINFTNTDKVTVIAAVRKLSDAVASIVTELSVNTQTNAGSFCVVAPIYTGANYAVLVNNGVSAPATTAAGYAAPTSNVISARLNTKGLTRIEQIGMRVDGVPKGDTSIISAGGNFGNYPLFIGRRGGTSLSFNGQIYALLVIGKLLDDATTQRIEKEFAKYIGVTL